MSQPAYAETIGHATTPYRAESTSFLRRSWQQRIEKSYSKQSTAYSIYDRRVVHGLVPVGGSISGVRVSSLACLMHDAPSHIFTAPAHSISSDHWVIWRGCVMIESQFKVNSRFTSGGRVTVDVVAAPVRVRFEAWYIHDGLKDLARTVRAVCRGCGEEHCIFEDEPGECRWLFTRSDEHSNTSERVFSIQILKFDECFPSHGSKKGKLELSVLVRQSVLLRSVIEMFQSLLDAHGEDGYKDLWHGHEFPMQELQDLRELAAGTAM